MITPTTFESDFSVPFPFFVRLKQVDSEQELIRLCSAEPTELKDLPMRVPKESPRYHFFLYKHSHEGDYLESTGTFLLAAGSSCFCPALTSCCTSYCLLFIPPPLSFLCSLHLFHARVHVQHPRQDAVLQLQKPPGGHGGE